MKRKPTIAIAMGDPAGIGPELIVKVLTDETLFDRCRPFIIGDLDTMRANAASARFRPALQCNQRPRRRLLQARCHRPAQPARLRAGSASAARGASSSWAKRPRAAWRWPTSWRWMRGSMASSWRR